jgi:hypothetical protein
VQEQSISARAGGLVSGMMNPWGRMMACKYSHSYSLKFQVVCFWVTISSNTVPGEIYEVTLFLIYSSNRESRNAYTVLIAQALGSGSLEYH